MKRPFTHWFLVVVMGAVIFLGVLVDQVSGQRKRKQQVLAPALAAK
jgi:hypothetical protein